MENTLRNINYLRVADFKNEMNLCSKLGRSKKE